MQDYCHICGRTIDAEPKCECHEEAVALRAKVSDMEWQIWRQLEMGEMTQYTDQVLIDKDWEPYNEDVPLRPAPDPRYTAHCRYRRRIADELRARVADLEAIQNNARATLEKWQPYLGENAFNDLANALNP